MADDDIIVPPLKWAGGKRWLVSNYPDLFPKKFNRYFEPFLGGAATFFHLRPQNAVLSDVNPDLINFYRVLRDEPEELAQRMKVLHRQHSKEFYYEMRARQTRTDLTRAAQFLYLNRTCWNGLYRVNLKGQFNVPIGTKSTVVLATDDFVAASEVLKNAALNACDFADTIDQAEEGDFVFADPPYTVKHNMNGFVKYNEKLFSWEDQGRLARAVKMAVRRGASICVSNADHETVRDLYADVGVLHILERQSVLAGTKEHRDSVTEILIANIT